MWKEINHIIIIDEEIIVVNDVVNIINLTRENLEIIKFNKVCEREQELPNLENWSLRRSVIFSLSY